MFLFEGYIWSMVLIRSVLVTMPVNWLFSRRGNAPMFSFNIILAASLMVVLVSVQITGVFMVFLTSSSSS